MRVDTVLEDIPEQTYGIIQVLYQAPHGSLKGVVAEYDFGDSINLKRERALTPASPTL